VKNIYDWFCIIAQHVCVRFGLANTCTSLVKEPRVWIKSVKQDRKQGR